MTILIAIIVIAIVVGLVFLNQSSFGAKQTREDYLKELAKHFNGPLELVEGHSKSYRIKFRFDGFDLIYEDFINAGFKNEVNKAQLKLPSSDSFSLEFHEKTQSNKSIASNLSFVNAADGGHQGQILAMPPKLKEFTIQTNNMDRLSKLFSDIKFVNVLSKFKNQDHRGYSFMAIKFVNGEMIMELLNENRYYPSLTVIHKNYHLIEDPIKDIISLHKILQKYS